MKVEGEKAIYLDIVTVIGLYDRAFELIRTGCKQSVIQIRLIPCLNLFYIVLLITKNHSCYFKFPDTFKIVMHAFCGFDNDENGR